MTTKIEGIPAGYELVRVGRPAKGEMFLGVDFAVCTASYHYNDHGSVYSIVKKTPLTLEVGKKYIAKNGDVFGPLEACANHPEYPFLCQGRYWSPAGVRFYEDDRDTEDLVAEYIEPKPVYRPFANAAEFAPHRDRWIQRVSGGGCFAVGAYSDTGIVYGVDSKSKSYNELLSFKFDNGDTCGVLVTGDSSK